MMTQVSGIGSAALGLLFLICFFVLCLITVLGIKSAYIALSRRFLTKPAEVPPKENKPKRKPIRSIVVNPDEIDRIVVKKND